MFQDRYTIQMENQLFNQWNILDDTEDDYSMILEFLNDVRVSSVLAMDCLR